LSAFEFFSDASFSFRDLLEAQTRAQGQLLALVNALAASGAALTTPAPGGGSTASAALIEALQQSVDAVDCKAAMVRATVDAQPRALERVLAQSSAFDKARQMDSVALGRQKVYHPFWSSCGFKFLI